MRNLKKKEMLPPKEESRSAMPQASLSQTGEMSKKLDKSRKK